MVITFLRYVQCICGLRQELDWGTDFRKVIFNVTEMTDQYGTMRFKRTCVDGKQVSCLCGVIFEGTGLISRG
jgi:hypothetical protein